MAMENFCFWNCVRSLVFLLLINSGCIVYGITTDGLISCLHTGGVTNLTTPSASVNNDDEYTSLLRFSLQNLRFTEPAVPKPALIIVPVNRFQVQKSVSCCIEHAWEIRVRSGGHSYEGFSSTSDIPFVLIDLMAFHNVNVDMSSETAWVEAGATLGEVYSAIAQKSVVHGFPGGVCPTVGSGGHFSGGGLGFLARKYGLAADNVIDALLIDASGEVLNRKSMGEDLFWAIRGGGGGSWGVVIEWKIKLVRVPSLVTVFTVLKTGRNHVTDALYRWQYVAPHLENNLFMRVQLFGISQGKQTTDIRASFHGMYLGSKNRLLHRVDKIFPELGMSAADCEEMSWIQSVSYFAGTNVSQLGNRYYPGKVFFKNKSDFARKPIPKSGLRGLWPMMEQELGVNIILSPLGGRMDEITSSALPFPHRAGTLFDIQYVLPWYRETGNDAARHVEYMRELYKYMSPYVSMSPRAAYVNYPDLDLGSAPFNGTSSVEEARKWGEKYFLHNFDRLVQVKSRVDPLNVFRNPQSIPPVPRN